MKKKLTLLILFFSGFIMAQTEIKNGAIIFDFGKKKKQQDTIQQLPSEPMKADQDEDNPDPKAKKEKKQPAAKNTEKNQPAPDFRKDGLFKALFHIGINASQIDGDNQAGYNQIGLDAGVGTLIRFHKFMSVSMSIDYSMKGARQKFIFDPNVPSLQKYQVQWDYMEVPLILNFHGRNLVIFGLGVQPAVLVRFKQWDQNGDDVTNASNLQQPRKFEMEGIGALHFVIKEHFLVGLKFSYSMSKARGYYDPSVRNGQYNNVLTLGFAYLMNTVKRKSMK